MVNRIHPTSIICGRVELGDNNFIAPGVIISGPVVIGNGNYFGPHSVIGGSPHDDLISALDHELQDSGQQLRYGSLAIGNRNVFREFSSVHRGMTGQTTIEDDCYFMSYSNIAHDSYVRSKVKVGASVQTGGYCRFGTHSYLGLASVFHQFTVVGGYSMIGLNSSVIKPILPGGKYAGAPARLLGPNAMALERLGLGELQWWKEYAANQIGADIPREMRSAVDDYLNDQVEVANSRIAASEFRKGMK